MESYHHEPTGRRCAIRAVLRDRSGSTVTEYAAVAALIAVAAISAFVGLGGEVDRTYTTVETSWKDAQ